MLLQSYSPFVLHSKRTRSTRPFLPRHPHPIPYLLPHLQQFNVFQGLWYINFQCVTLLSRRILLPPCAFSHWQESCLHNLRIDVDAHTRVLAWIGKHAAHLAFKLDNPFLLAGTKIHHWRHDSPPRSVTTLCFLLLEVLVRHAMAFHSSSAFPYPPS